VDFKVGDLVICVVEENMPQFIGTEWVVVCTLGNLYLCKNDGLYDDTYPFKEHEINLASPLMRELV